LVNCLTDEISRKLLLKFFDIFERVMPLRHWHRSGIKPHVNQFLHAPHGTLPAVHAGKLHAVDKGPVQVHPGEVAAG